MIGIIDYGMGNLYSVEKAFERLRFPAFLSGDRKELEKADGLLLPGVGAFPDAMKALYEQELVDWVQEKAANGTPLFGICLGMQLLFEESEEIKPTKGLGLLEGRIIPFRGMDDQGNRYKVPHMGWNRLTFEQPDSPIVKDTEEGYVYFVHSYLAETTPELTIASATYETKVPGVVGRGNVFGAQFHPEKSGATGMKLLENYCDFVQNKKG